jgi:hypothetical protein
VRSPSQVRVEFEHDLRTWNESKGTFIVSTEFEDF